MKKIFVFIVLLTLFVSCADKVRITVIDDATHVYGFFGGLWHGLIAPFDFVGMLIWDDVAMYAPNNNGAGYALGFLLGGGCWGLSVRIKRILFGS